MRWLRPLWPGWAQMSCLQQITDTSHCCMSMFHSTVTSHFVYHIIVQMSRSLLSVERVALCCNTACFLVQTPRCCGTGPGSPRHAPPPPPTSRQHRAQWQQAPARHQDPHHASIPPSHSHLVSPTDCPLQSPVAANLRGDSGAAAALSSHTGS